MTKILHKAAPVSDLTHPRCAAIETRQIVRKLTQQADRRTGSSDKILLRRRRMRLDGMF